MSIADSPAIRRRKLFKGLSASSAIRIGGGLLAIIVFIAIFAPWLASHDPIAQDLGKRMVPPFWYPGSDPAHLLGTDHLGRDYLARLLHGARVSILIGLGVTLCAGFIGTMLGLAAGYFGGRVDMAISFIVTTRLSLPIVLVALAAVALGGASLKTLAIVLSLLLWDRFAVVVRSAAQSLRSREFVQATQSFGASHLYIMLHGILPNLRNTLIVVATLEIANVILLEAALSFLGLGAQPPTPSWGLMIAEGREHILFDPWLIALPGAGLCLLILAVNLLGDGVRDALDERR
ncbi:MULTISPECIES: ABC transporter permease [Bosea]|jgi:peptide/nickel transport system permease protein|uniref:ABC transporter permease n=1 Tax=Bosea TaxID=85413 RepID=UPI00214FBE10|nr:MULTISPECIES: ABC transporter permease [Bosea]MCR4520318.1 ABC transporter permease [Bosea sp. 47.2.35]MDR6828659.1 peptide/nickel transport system permease protein [Bosea robiniae]MDR6895318.1 peptide/nickel transport system permease protein [Bosea sp. BE109]MDR7138714.1 peptide/nickel transport system permease protein [Bosea sp. BE168]MDR7175311.1 peptide/nickel transport system permease protein [Bosea sp. BE271]